MRLIDNAWREFNRLWSIRASVAFGMFLGISSVLGALTDTLNPWLLIGLAAFINGVVLPLLRIAKQADPA